jgi:hypothetical protein
MFYAPIEDPREQKMEKVWFDKRNKDLSDKRAEEEKRQLLREWCGAKTRLEIES